MVRMTERTMRLHDVASAVVATALTVAWVTVVQPVGPSEPFLRGLKEGAIIIVPLCVALEFLYDRLEMRSRKGGDEVRLSDYLSRGPAVMAWVFHGVFLVCGVVALRVWPQDGMLVGLLFAMPLGNALGRWAVAEVAMRKRAVTSAR